MSTGVSQRQREKGRCIALPRGGSLIETSVGYMQVGSPPETIKDTMRLPRSTPQIFLLPNSLFHVHKGISVAELEFPIYHNHFLRQKKTYIVCTQQQCDQLITVLNEAIFGPSQVDFSSEYINGADTFGYPNMKAEMDYFRGGRSLADLVQFVIFRNNMVSFNNVRVTKTQSGDFRIEDEDWNFEIDAPGEVGFNIIYDTGKRPAEPYRPPLLGVTCLGPSHGFDVEDNTSGFLLWIQRKGIMVDPPVNSTEWLRESNVNPKLIDTVILTHTHADHDAGTFQKILEEDRITIYSTETVIHSFVGKYHALTQIPIKELFSLFNFVPVIIERPYIINSAEFRFRYALHSIPSLSFDFTFQDQSFVYSSDHLNDPDKYKEMLEEGVLTEGRYKDLLNFPWHSNIIYHEAGIPPLHTRIDYLRTLPDEIQKKTTVYHIARKDMPANTSLNLATFGIENTLYPPISPPKHEEALQVLDVLASIDIFRDFPVAKAKEFLNIVNKETFSKDQLIIEKDTPGDKFFIIISGNVNVENIDYLKDENKVEDEEKSHSKQYGSYEYFGEASLITGQMRSASVLAVTDVVALTIDKHRFLNFIKGSPLVQKFSLLKEIRDTNSWEILSESRFFQGMTSAQKTQLELIMHLKEYTTGNVFIQRNQIAHSAYVLKSGQVEVRLDSKCIEVLKTGDFFGEIYNLQKGTPSSYTFVSVGDEDTEVYEIHKKDMTKYINDNPGVYMRLNYIYGT